MSKTADVELRVQPDEKTAWRKAAQQLGIPMSRWIRACCNTVLQKPQVLTGAVDTASLLARCRFGGCARLGKALCDACLAARGS